MATLSYCVCVCVHVCAIALFGKHKNLGGAGFGEHINELFLKKSFIKFEDVVKFRTLQIMYKVKDNIIPENTHKCSTTQKVSIV